MRSNLAIVASVLAFNACGSEKAPPTPAAATAAPATPAAVAPEADVIITEVKADPDKMPNDAIHAGLNAHGDTTARAPQRMNPTGPMVASAQPAEEGVALPLPLEGSGSVGELNRRKALVDAKFHGILEEAFRKLFTIERQNRDGARARIILDQLMLESDPKLKATALRLLGFMAINSGFDEVTALARYQEALALDADYGEVHYAVAFTLGPRDPKTGRVHFDRALALGVPDLRKLKDQFYKD